MKIAIKTTAQKNTAPHTASNKNTHTTSNKNKRKIAVAKDDNSKEPKKFTVARILEAFHTQGVDGSPIWMGESVNQAAAHRLFAQREEIANAKVTPTHGKFLTVLGRQLYIWPLTGLHGDTYERKHSDKLNVKGSLKFLTGLFGTKNVRVLSKDEAQAMTKKFRTDKSGRQSVFA